MSAEPAAGRSSLAVGVILALVGGAAVAGALLLMLSTGPNSGPAPRGTNEEFSSLFALLLLLTGIGAAIWGAVELDSIPGGIAGQLFGALIPLLGAGVYVAVAGNELSGSDIGVTLNFAIGAAAAVGVLQAAGVTIARRRRGGRRDRSGTTDVTRRAT